MKGGRTTRRKPEHLRLKTKLVRHLDNVWRAKGISREELDKLDALLQTDMIDNINLVCGILTVRYGYEETE